MHKKVLEKDFENEAKLSQHELEDHTNCEQCMEDFIFAMEDSTHQCSIGLRTILECLAIAEAEEAVPPLPYEWWHLINNRYH